MGWRPEGRRHIGTGTDFAEHAGEANSGFVFQLPEFGGAGMMSLVRRTFLAHALESRHDLQPGDRVAHRSNHLGDIEDRLTD